MLYALGSIVFEVAPMNVDQIGRTAGADFAEKPVFGRRPGFEFVGAAAEEITFQGKLFPAALGGLDEWDDLQAIRATGDAQHLLRGDGTIIGWYQIVALQDTGTALDAAGVPRVIEFEIRLREADRPAADAYQGAQLGLIR
ncbi:phage tail protein [Phenylobacterium sp.]|uniref:phage tail protein n=1 Tax=Phenylobacterium sp. TaxID=1871053 RepID=UPI00272F9696|nr:phage tail protein [Phenylobacterium sp.]MDP2214782.1 phage tail protein [Phenylobacterium sp.]